MIAHRSIGFLMKLAAVLILLMLSACFQSEKKGIEVTIENQSGATIMLR